MLEKTARMMMGRKRWIKLNFEARVIQIQRAFRGRLGRVYAASTKRRKIAMLLNLRYRMKIHHRRTKKRSAAGLVIEKFYRGMLGRRRAFYYLKVRAAMRIQQWNRTRWAVGKMRSFVLKLITCQGFVRMIRPRLQFLRRHLVMRDEAVKLGNEHMKEILKLLQIDEFFSDSETHPHEERKRVAETLIRHKITIRRLYLKYSIILVSAPDKCFQMSRSQFVRFIKDSGLLGKKVDQTFADTAFALSNMDVKDGKTVTTGSKIDPSNPANVMMPDEFCEALMRLADKVLRDKVKPLSARIDAMMEEYWEPISNTDLDITEPEAPGLGVEGSDTNACIEENYTRIVKCFNHYGGANDSGAAADDSSIDCVEWMMACKECEIIDASTSFSKVLEIFVRCNQDELEDYFYGMPNAEEIREMNLELEEFLHAVVATAALQPAKKKTDPFRKKLDAFLEKLLTGGPRKFNT